MPIRIANLVSPQAQRRFTKYFTPKGRRSPIIYAVSLAEHPSLTKIGRTLNWNTRRKQYASWNLAKSNAITAQRTFLITEEFIDLPALEKHIIDMMPFPKLSHRSEWFETQIDDAAREIDRILTAASLAYIIE